MLEKSYPGKMSSGKTQRSRRQPASSLALLVLWTCFVPLRPAFAQINSGAAFLKVLPGARHQGMAGTVTGVIDDMHALYANPAATATLREWQWSTTYTEWIADSYQLSLSYGRRLRTPWSRRMNVAMGLQYQGVREFDSTNRGQPAASANDLLLTLSMGTPLTAFSKRLALGGNVKYFRSELDQFSASSWVFDVGVLYRSRRFELDVPFLKYAILSAGLSVTNLGKPLTFINSETPLPRSVQTGISVNLGSHRGVQLQLSADYKKVRDEKAHFSLGSELSWNYRLALRGGYTFSRRSLNRFSFGFSLRLDDHASPLHSFPGRNKALRVDFAGVGKKEIFETTYQAALSHFPTAPEAFHFVAPLSGENMGNGEVEFIWTAAQDPDLYDEVGYIFLLQRVEPATQDSVVIAALADVATRERTDQLRLPDDSHTKASFARDVTAEVSMENGRVHYVHKDLLPGVYYWTVAAYDQDNHVRFADKKGLPLGHFKVLPDLYITDLRFHPHPWIEESSYQGDLAITISNKGKTVAEEATLAIYDSMLTQTFESTGAGAPPTSLGSSSGRAANGSNGESALNGGNGAHEAKWFEQVVISKLAVDTDTTIIVPWRTDAPGLYRITAKLDPHNTLPEYDESNNDQDGSFYTIPRGIFLTSAEAVTQIDSLYEYELPFIPKIYFEHGRADIKRLGSSLIYSPLQVLATRFKKEKNLRLRLRGFVDLENGEPKPLAQARAQEVKQELVRLGIDPTLIDIAKGRRPDVTLGSGDAAADPDRKWVAQERRFVRISVFSARGTGRQQEEVRLFYSVPVSLPKSKTFLPVTFTSSVRGFVALQTGRLAIYSDARQYTALDFTYATADTEHVIWTLDDVLRRDLQNRTVTYSISLQDVHGRIFRTKPRQALLATEKRNLLDQKIIIGVAEFRKDRPESNLDWQSVAQKVENRLRRQAIRNLDFVGHACAIGDSVYNHDLSLLRAQNFYKEFARRYPKLVRGIKRQFHNIGVIGEGENGSFNMAVDRKLFLKTLRKHNPDEFNRITYELVSGQKHDRRFPFTFRLQGDTIFIESDNNTPFGRQINRRIEILIDPVEKRLPKLSQRR
ncbi:MAG: PorV/PorQ family protein [bacterium]